MHFLFFSQTIKNQNKVKVCNANNKEINKQDLL